MKMKKVNNHVLRNKTKVNIPKSLRSTVWIQYAGPRFETKCWVTWCKTMISPFTFEVGHDIPESKGGATHVKNLRPICTQCNKSMGNRFSIEDFSRKFSPLSQPKSLAPNLASSSTLSSECASNDINRPTAKPNIFRGLIACWSSTNQKHANT